MTAAHMQVERLIRAGADEIFAVLTDPKGHVAIDSSGNFPCRSSRVTRVSRINSTTRAIRESMRIDRPLPPRALLVSNQ